MDPSQRRESGYVMPRRLSMSRLSSRAVARLKMQRAITYFVQSVRIKSDQSRGLSSQLAVLVVVDGDLDGGLLERCDEEL